MAELSKRGKRALLRKRRNSRLEPSRAKLAEAAEHIEHGRHEDALGMLDEVLSFDPNDVDGLYLKAAAQYRLELRDAAQCTAEHLLDCKPDHVHAMNLLANIHQDFAQWTEAEHWYRRAIEQSPQEAKVYNNLGTLLRYLGRHREALEAFDKAVEYFPAYPDALTNKGNAMLTLQRPAEAQRLYRQSLDFDPQNIRTWIGMGKALEQMGIAEEALVAFKEAEKLEPDNSIVRWNLRLLMPMVPRTEGELANYSSRLATGINELTERWRLDDEKLLQGELVGAQERTVFTAHYRHFDQTPMQKQLGGYFVDMAKAAFPELGARPSKASRIRVGYVGFHMFEHVVGKYTEGWLKHHDYDKFEVKVFHTGFQRDERTEALEKYAPVIELRGHTGQIAEQLLDEQLDVIVYPELGMYAPTLQLAALPLAKTQCVHFGHPVTSGMETMHYFLSGETIEPDNGDEHYCEDLVRLPGFGICYNQPNITNQPLTRKELNLPEDKFIFLSPQSLFKYQPQFDHLYAQVLAKNSSAHIAFLGNKTKTLEARFVSRIRKACRAHGVVFEERCTIVAPRPYRDFMRIYPAVDAMLDIPTFSGGNTSLEGLAYGKPIVAIPGPFMRSRLTAGMLKAARLYDTLALDEEEYVETAHRLVEDNAWRKDVVQKIHDAKPRLFDRIDIMRAAEELYINRCR